MRADLQTYRNAASVSVKGLLLQVLVASVLAVYGFWAKDPAALTGAFFTGIGALAWLTLWVLYDQHRRERIEAMELEALSASGAAESSVFETREDFRPAARRLAGLYKFFVPTNSILMGLLLVGLGLWRFMAATGAKAPAATDKGGWAMGIGLAIGAVGFVSARYVAGLSKQAVWSNLRGGAAWIMGASLTGILIAVAQFMHAVGEDVGVAVLPRVLAVTAGLIGAETFFNFVLAIYRPRRAGELPRPAFDSNLLALFAVPDRVVRSIGGAISYQLGFDVTSGWMYQLLSRRLPLLAALGAVIVWGLTSIAVVEPHQRAMVLRFGRPVRTDVGPGLHFKAPWPIDSVYVPEFLVKDASGKKTVQDRTATGLRRVELGTLPPATMEPILWTNDHIGAEVWQYVRIGAGGGGGGGITDIASVSAEIPMQFTVKDVLVYDLLGPPDHRDEYLRVIAQREVTRFFQSVSLDEVLGGDRAALSARLRENVQAALDRLNPDERGVPRGAGVEIAFLGITGAHPPKEAAPSFETPVQAAQRREANITSAQTDAAVRLTSVAGSRDLAETIVREITAYDALSEEGSRLAPGGPEAAALSARLVEQEIKITNLLSGAGGSAAAVLAEAKASRWTKHMSARREAARYEGQLARYEAAPRVFMVREYFRTFGEIMKNSRLYIVPDNVRDPRYDLDVTDKELALDIFRKPDAQ